MITLVTAEEQVTQVMVVRRTITCNKCGAELDTIVDGEEQHPDDQFHEILLYGGWCNWVIGDGTKTTFHLCQLCVNELLDSFKIPVILDCGIKSKERSWPEWKAVRPAWRT